VRSVAKASLNALGLLLASLYIVYAKLLGLLVGEVGFSHAAYALAVIPGFLGVSTRRAFYCVMLHECHWDVHVGFGSAFTHPTAVVGKRVWIGAYSLIGRCTLGDDVVIGSRVSVLSGRHQHRFDRLDLPIRAQPGVLEEVAVGEDCWLGEGCIITADVGAGCVVGAGAVVVDPIEPLSVVVGNPARQVATRGSGPESSAYGTR